MQFSISPNLEGGINVHESIGFYGIVFVRVAYLYKYQAEGKGHCHDSVPWSQPNGVYFDKIMREKCKNKMSESEKKSSCNLFRFLRK